MLVFVFLPTTDAFKFKFKFPENISSTVLKAIFEASSTDPLYVTPKKSKKAALTVVMDSTVACSYL